MGFERNYQVKIHSKQISVSKSYNRAEGASSTDVNPWFISGLIDANPWFIIGLIDVGKIN
jgi:lysozyme family protein